MAVARAHGATERAARRRSVVWGVELPGGGRSGDLRDDPSSRLERVQCSRGVAPHDAFPGGHDDAIEVVDRGRRGDEPGALRVRSRSVEWVVELLGERRVGCHRVCVTRWRGGPLERAVNGQRHGYDDVFGARFSRRLARLQEPGMSNI